MNKTTIISFAGIVKISLFALIINGLIACTQSKAEEIDLNRVLDVTVDTLTNYNETLDKEKNPDADKAFAGFADELAINYSESMPPIYKNKIGVRPQADASLLAYDDANANLQLDDGEEPLFKIEIDGENARIIASSRSGAVNDHSFSGTSLLAGYLIGSMLTRQRGAGVNTKALASKQPVTSKAAAKARAGSGSHSKGK